jgi:hypothetical protein
MCFTEVLSHGIDEHLILFFETIESFLKLKLEV